MDEVERIEDTLGRGYIDQNKASEIQERFPGVASRILDILTSLQESGEWRRFNKIANLAVWLHPEGMGRIIATVLRSRPRGVNMEDLVEISEDVKAEEAVPEIARIIDEPPGDTPDLSLSVKCVQALGGIGGEEAGRILRAVATGDYPSPLKWHAAEELDITDELGFDEDEMLQQS